MRHPPSGQSIHHGCEHAQKVGQGQADAGPVRDDAGHDVAQDARQGVEGSSGCGARDDVSASAHCQEHWQDAAQNALGLQGGGCRQDTQCSCAGLCRGGTQDSIHDGAQKGRRHQGCGRLWGAGALGRRQARQQGVCGRQ